MNKKAIQFGFGWMFAVLVGGIVLFLAIFAASRFTETNQLEIDTKTAAQMGVLLHPVETNLESGRYAQIKFSEQTRFFNSCNALGDFGRQGLSTSTKGINNVWSERSIETTFSNKYIFSQKQEEGTKLHVFVKPLTMPYKIADLIMLSSSQYCFINAPSEIEEEANDLGLENIFITQSQRACPQQSISVCFSGGICSADIRVNTNFKTVTKGRQQVYYEGPLLYAAIFSEIEVYECQVKRLMKRASNLAVLYADKTQYLSDQGCSSNLKPDLLTLASLSNNLENSKELSQVTSAALQIDNKNDQLICRLY